MILNYKVIISCRIILIIYSQYKNVISCQLTSCCAVAGRLQAAASCWRKGTFLFYT